MQTLQLTRPDDFHIHLRDGDYLATTVKHAAEQFARAIVMPNLLPPVTTAKLADEYRQRILAARPAGSDFSPLMTLYLTDQTSPQLIQQTAALDWLHACKLYPAGATTNSQSGVTDITKLYPALAEMEKLRMPLLLHGEVNDPANDIFDREKLFIETVLNPLMKKFPNLPIVLEHITTKDAVDFVLDAPANLAATITAHHLLYNRNDLLSGGIKPHYYCLPILKRGQHQQALIEAATSGNAKFFLGTDSAPHAQNKKEAACGCAGIYTAHAAIELYAHAFEQAGKLDKLEAFASFYGADFYGLARNQQKITLLKQPWQVPEQIDYAESKLIPLAAGETLQWKLQA